MRNSDTAKLNKCARPIELLRSIMDLIAIPGSFYGLETGAKDGTVRQQPETEN